MWLTWQENLDCAPGLRPKSDHAMSTFAFLYKMPIKALAL